LYHFFDFPRPTPVTPMPTKTRPRGAARREALLEAVLQIVAEVGADAVTHRRVAEVAELPLASTTYWFSSKEHLLTAALELAAERDISRLTAFAEQRSHDDPIEAIVSLVLDPVEDGLRTSRGSLIATYTLLLEAARRPALREITARWTAAYFDAGSELLQRAGSSDPRGDAELLVAAADGLLIEELSRGGSTDLRPRLRRLAAALIAGR
jgi:TetR/AcrR family transcriptional regulator, regulator of biofilm formation and stress response